MFTVSFIYMECIPLYLFVSDAFAQEGNAPDEKEAPGWMNDWTIFYWGWWIAWSPFVGMFIAKISRGMKLIHYGNIYHVHYPCLLLSSIKNVMQIIYIKGTT